MYILLNKKINIINANTFKLRLLGLMNKKNINYGILFKNCHSIHTFFMKEKIDIILLDNNYIVKYIYSNFNKNRILIKNNIKHIIELPQNTIDKSILNKKLIIYEGEYENN